MFEINPMNLENALKISNWTYDEPYFLYSFKECKETLFELLENDYYVVNKFPENELFGYFCFGDAAKVYTNIEDDYADEALDIGLGMKPEFCGKGMGYSFLMAGLEFSKKYKLKGKSKIRLTVADFNKRAIHLYEKLGFKYVKSIHVKYRVKFNIMMLYL